MPIKTTQTKETHAVASTSIADLQKLCSELRKVEFTLRGKKCALEFRDLTPAQTARIVEIIELVIPKIVKGVKQEDDRLNLTDPEYLKEKAAAAIKGRALTIYLSYPAIQAQKPGLEDLTAITEFIQSGIGLPESVISVLYDATQRDVVTSAELVNFT